MTKEILCAFGVDVDAVAGWLGSYGGEHSPDDISRGMFAGEVGVPRLVQLFQRYDLTTTWFIPGHRRARLHGTRPARRRTALPSPHRTRRAKRNRDRQQRQLQRLDQNVYRPTTLRRHRRPPHLRRNIIETGTSSYRLAHARAQRATGGAKSSRHPGAKSG